METYYYVPLENADYAYYAIVTPLENKDLHVYMLHPRLGSKEFLLNHRTDGGYESNIIIDTDLMQDILGALSISREPLPPAGDKINFRDGMLHADLYTGGCALIHREYFPDDFDGLMPTGMFDIQVYDNGAYRIYTVEPDAESDMYVLSPEYEEAPDSLELYDINKAIKQHLGSWNKISLNI